MKNKQKNEKQRKVVLDKADELYDELLNIYEA